MVGLLFEVASIIVSVTMILKTFLVGRKNREKLNAIFQELKDLTGSPIEFSHSLTDSNLKAVSEVLDDFGVLPLILLGLMLLNLSNLIHAEIIVGLVIIVTSVVYSGINLWNDRSQLREYKEEISSKKRIMLLTFLKQNGFTEQVKSIETRHYLLLSYKFHVEIVQESTNVLLEVIQHSIIHGKLSEQLRETIKRSLKEFDLLLGDLLDKKEEETRAVIAQEQMDVNELNKKFINTIREIRKNVNSNRS